MFSRLFGRNKPRPYFSMAEYWAYLPALPCPTQEAVMERMLKSRPFRGQGKEAVGPKEMLIWSDIRFHFGLALRERNAHLFRPDVFDAHVEVEPAQLEALNRAVAIVKLRYVSRERLDDRRHLQFLVHATEAVGTLGRAEVVFDFVSERLLNLALLQDQLASDSDGTRRELHLRTIWRPGVECGSAETRGLPKVGLPELRTPDTMPDHRVVASQVLELAAERMWDEGAIPDDTSIEHYGDTFHVVVDYPRKGAGRARILREHP